MKTTSYPCNIGRLATGVVVKNFQVINHLCLMVCNYNFLGR